MITSTSYAAIAYGVTQNGPDNTLTEKPLAGQNSPATGHGIVKDHVDLSPSAQRTLEQKKNTEIEEQDRLTDEILSKGFQSWAQEKYREKIEAEIRAQVLSSMGLNEDDFTTLEAEVQQRIEDIIKEKVREKMQEAMEKEFEESGNGLSSQFLSI